MLPYWWEFSGPTPYKCDVDLVQKKERKKIITPAGKNKKPAIYFIY